MNNLSEIPTEKFEYGIEKLFDNVKDLLMESKLLLENERWSRSYALSQLALEELAKIFLLYRLWFDRINNDSSNESEYDNIFTNHKKKTEFILTMEQALFEHYIQAKNKVWAKNYYKRICSELSSIKIQNDLKNESLYVTLKNGDFQTPSDAISETTAREFFEKVMFRKELFQIIKNHTGNHIIDIAERFKEGDSI